MCLAQLLSYEAPEDPSQVISRAIEMKKQVCALGWHNVDEDDLDIGNDGAGQGDYFDFEALTTAEVAEATMIPNSRAKADGTIINQQTVSKS